MDAGWVLLYFVLACVALALGIFPELRRAALPLARGGGRWLGRAGRWVQATAGGVLGAGRPGLVSAQTAAPMSPRAWSVPWRWIGAGALLLAIPVCGVWMWGQWAPRHLEGFDDRVMPANAQVMQLLHGEHLVPPAPLPPEMFRTPEVQAAHPMLASADRRWDRMDPKFVQRLLTVFQIMKARHGYDMALLEGWRSPERQAALAAQGSHVTMAAPGQSLHQHGLGADCAFVRDGRLVISERDPWAMRGYQLYGEVAEELGLTWGGRWRMMDFGHVEWRKAGPSQRAAAAP